MKRFLPLLLVLALAQVVLLLGCSKKAGQVVAPKVQLSATRAPLLGSANTDPRTQDSYIVVLKDAVADVDGEVDQIGQQLSVTAAYRYRNTIKGFAARLTPGMVEALRSNPSVDYIEHDQIAHIVATQTGATWGLDRIDQRALPLSTTYTYNTTGLGVDAYCIDTGIRFTHAEFGGRAVTGYDAITIGGTAADGNGHGTHTAGTIGGTIYGVAKAARLIAVRVLDNSGSGSYSQVVAGIDWVTGDHTTRPAVANMSLGGPADAALDAAVRRSIADGVTYCVSAGNSAANVSTQSPADVAEAITVGATDITDTFASFSNFGAGVDISGPGVNITSAWFTTNTATNTISGTSMSSPHVAGAAALYLEANPTSTPAAVQTALTTAATTGVIKSLPSGTVNRLLYSLTGAPPPPPPPPAAPTLASPADLATGVAIPAALSWNASTGATSYGVQVSTSAAFTTLAFSQSVTTTSASATGLAASTVYYWRVNATNAGGTSAYSTVRRFTTAATPPPPPGPPVPVLVAPANAATNVAVPATLSWSASTGATSYRVQVSTSSAFTTLFLDRPGVTTLSTSVTGLASQTLYYWRVSASNVGGTSAFSAARSFTTRCTGDNCNN